MPGCPGFAACSLYSHLRLVTRASDCSLAGEGLLQLYVRSILIPHLKDQAMVMGTAKSLCSIAPWHILAEDGQDERCEPFCVPQCHNPNIRSNQQKEAGKMFKEFIESSQPGPL